MVRAQSSVRYWSAVGSCPAVTLMPAVPNPAWARYTVWTCGENMIAGQNTLICSILRLWFKYSFFRLRNGDWNVLSIFSGVQPIRLLWWMRSLAFCIVPPSPAAPPHAVTVAPVCPTPPRATSAAVLRVSGVSGVRSARPNLFGSPLSVRAPSWQSACACSSFSVIIA